MNVVMIIPTGIGCEIGGHAGDANPVAKLIGACCDNLILHPNVVNASDINEMPSNALYVEGSILNRFLSAQIYLKKVKKNSILLVVNPPVKNETVNAASAARVTIGAEVKVLELKTPLKMIGRIEEGRATGDVIGWEQLVKQVNEYEFDALAIQSTITCKRDISLNYLHHGGVNPWGGVEALASRLIADAIDKPVAHAPAPISEETDAVLKSYNEVSDPRMAAEIISTCFVHCVLKGLHSAPRIAYDKSFNCFSVDMIDCMVSPMCFGEPHLACIEQDIPIIMVKENKTIYESPEIPDGIILVNNYVEAVGHIMLMKAGVALESVRRPIAQTEILK